MSIGYRTVQIAMEFVPFRSQYHRRRVSHVSCHTGNQRYDVEGFPKCSTIARHAVSNSILAQVTRSTRGRVPCAVGLNESFPSPRDLSDPTITPDETLNHPTHHLAKQSCNDASWVCGQLHAYDRRSWDDVQKDHISLWLCGEISPVFIPDSSSSDRFNNRISQVLNYILNPLPVPTNERNPRVYWRKDTS